MCFTPAEKPLEPIGLSSFSLLLKLTILSFEILWYRTQVISWLFWSYCDLSQIWYVIWISFSTHSTGLCQRCTWVLQGWTLTGVLVLLILCLLPVLFLLPAADPLDLQEHLLLISLARLLARTYKRQLLEDQMVASCGSCGSYWGEWCIL